MNLIKGLMILKKTNYFEIQNKLININKDPDINLEPLLINYFENYYSESIFEDVSFEISNNNNLIFCPLTIERKDKENYLNFYGNYFFIFFIRFDNKLFNYLEKTIEDIKNKKKIKSIKFLIKKEFIFNEQQSIDHSFLDKISINKSIDLSLDLNEIIKNFSKGHRSAIKKNYTELEYQIIDKKNYNNEINEMMKLHEEVSGRKTRAYKTWIINEQMIKENKGVIIKVLKNDEAISYSFFFKNNFEAIYFSSCTKREFFKNYNNINHKSILHVIEYLKRFNCKRLTLGNSKTIYDKHQKNNKEINIEKFKSSFGGKKYINLHFNIFNNKIINFF